jgi:RNA polymerase sigma-70 factor (ECF subfamily)
VNPNELDEVLGRARKGDPEAWGRVYRDFAPVVRRLCGRALPTREDAEDATTEVFLKVRMKLDRYDGDRPFGPWLLRVAANHCWDRLRRRSRERWHDDEAAVDRASAAGSDPLERLVRERARREVRAALARLPDRMRMALVLRYFLDQSYDEIGKTFGLDAGAAGVLLLRARRRLRELLEPREGRA